jgi:transposase InsO family protein
MTRNDDDARTLQSWAQFRFSVVGPLLASPPRAGDLYAAIERLSQKIWRHPITGESTTFAFSTIERWYYASRSEPDPVGALLRKRRRDSGIQSAVNEKVEAVLRGQYRDSPYWSYQLHLDNLAVVIEAHPELGHLPSYSSVRRFMVSQRLFRQRRPRGRRRHEDVTGAVQARVTTREVRSFEAEYVSGLWHLDFHHGSLPVLTSAGEWNKPVLLAILDDRSRLICHAQWYLSETAEDLIHGLVQAFLKRGLPRALLSDNGSAMLAGETTQGLQRLAVVHETTLPYSPHQNGKQEVFWAVVEGRLMAMLERQRELNLSLLNQATQAWVELDYHKSVHSQTGQTPLARWLAGPSVERECPDLHKLQLSFTAHQTRTQRRSDGTISVDSVRFEVPSRYRHIKRLHIRYASWDMSHVWLMDERSDTVLTQLFPLNKTRNAERYRRAVGSATDSPADSSEVFQTMQTAPSEMAPLLRKLMADYAATGLPPAYIPKDDLKEKP